jgi:signal transduction histidine kinase
VLGVIRWLLPLVLAVVAVFFEWSEHIAHSGEELNAGFFGEIVIFAIVGPVAVAVTLGWVSRLVAGYVTTWAELETLNRGLEASVADRTQHLRTATDQLAAANAELARANLELTQLDRLKSEFVSLVSHQLRAPLTNINGALELVAQDADLLPAASQRTLQILAAESQRLSHLIQTILDLSRLEAGRLVLRLGPVAVEPLLARVLASSLAAEPDRPRSLDVAHGIPPAWADEILVEEVVRNLLENALRYSPPGSPVVVSAHPVPDGIEIAVEDHGPGIAPEETDRIFLSYHRLGDAETTPKGYGLGLYFVDKLVAAQHGQTSVRSPIHADPAAPGTRFSFTLPIAGDEPEGEA